MDTFTHGLLAANIAQTVQKNKPKRIYIMAAFCGAIIPDLDLLIHSANNPILAFQYHRHFTHALLFTPIGAFITALLFWLLFARSSPFLKIFLFSLLGYATHPLLDACTSFGTPLFLPFSDRRVSWDIIAIVDLFFTLPLLIGWIASLISTKRQIPLICLSLSLLYLGFGAFQHHQAFLAQREIARQRSHYIEHSRVMPTFLNLFLWRSLYVANGEIYADGINLILGKEPVYWKGGHDLLFKKESILEKISSDSKLAKDLRIYEWFADGFLIQSTTDPNVILDVRYSLFPEELSTPPWAIRIDLDHPEKPIEKLKTGMRTQGKVAPFFQMVFRRRSGFQLVYSQPIL